MLDFDRKYETLAPRWRIITGKRLLRLEHGARLLQSTTKVGRQPRSRAGVAPAGGCNGDESARAAPLSGLDEEDSESSMATSIEGEDR